MLSWILLYPTLAHSSPPKLLRSYRRGILLTINEAGNVLKSMYYSDGKLNSTNVNTYGKIVAPEDGAWVEKHPRDAFKPSHPCWVRGLKNG